MTKLYKKRRSLFVLLIATICLVSAFYVSINLEPAKQSEVKVAGQLANLALKDLGIKGRASKTGYSRSQFGSAWSSVQGCSTRNIILNRDLKKVEIDEKCNVISGVLDDPYSGKDLIFKKGDKSSDGIDIDHVVALSDAWQKGAQQLDYKTRVRLANDPINLLAVASNLNIQKGDSDAASWLPPNKDFRCQYVARQIAVKRLYGLWVSLAEFKAMESVLVKCPNQLLPEA